GASYAPGTRGDPGPGRRGTDQQFLKVLPRPAGPGELRRGADYPATDCLPPQVVLLSSGQGVGVVADDDSAAVNSDDAPPGASSAAPPAHRRTLRRSEAAA